MFTRCLSCETWSIWLLICVCGSKHLTWLPSSCFFASFFSLLFSLLHFGGCCAFFWFRSFFLSSFCLMCTWIVKRHAVKESMRCQNSAKIYTSNIKCTSQGTWCTVEMEAECEWILHLKFVQNFNRKNTKQEKNKKDKDCVANE